MCGFITESALLLITEKYGLKNTLITGFCRKQNGKINRYVLLITGSINI